MAVGLSPEFTSAYLQAQQGMFSPYQNYNPYGSPYAPMAPQQTQTQPRVLPNTMEELSNIRFQHLGGSTGQGQAYLDFMLGDSDNNPDVLRRKVDRALQQGVLSYADPLPTAQPQGMFSPYMIPQMPSYIGGVNYPQFNMFNPYTQGMFSPFMAYGSPYGSNV